MMKLSGSSIASGSRLPGTLPAPQVDQRRIQRDARRQEARKSRGLAGIIVPGQGAVAGQGGDLDEIRAAGRAVGVDRDDDVAAAGRHMHD